MDLSIFNGITIPEGDVIKIEANGIVLWNRSKGYTNQVRQSIDTDGSIFNGIGYQDNMRVRSGGAVGSWDGAVATGYIPVKAGDIVRFTCDDWDTNASNGNCINLGYISNKAFTSIGSYTTTPATYGMYSESSWSKYKATKEKDNIWKLEVPPDNAITHLRMSCYGTGANLIVTVNEEITDQSTISHDC